MCDINNILNNMFKIYDSFLKKINFFFFNSQMDFPKMDIYKCPISILTNEN